MICLEKRPVRWFYEGLRFCLLRKEGTTREGQPLCQSRIKDNERLSMHQEEAHVPIYNIVAETHDTDPFSADFSASNRVRWEQQWKWKRHAVTNQDRADLPSHRS